MLRRLYGGREISQKHLKMIAFAIDRWIEDLEERAEDLPEEFQELQAHLQSSVFKLSKDLIDSIHEEGIVAYTS